MKRAILYYVPKAFMDNFPLTLLAKEGSPMQGSASSGGGTLGMKVPVACITQDHSDLVVIATTEQAWPRVNFFVFWVVIKVSLPALN